MDTCIISDIVLFYKSKTDTSLDVLGGYQTKDHNFNIKYRFTHLPSVSKM